MSNGHTASISNGFANDTYYALLVDIYSYLSDLRSRTTLTVADFKSNKQKWKYDKRIILTNYAAVMEGCNGCQFGWIPDIQSETQPGIRPDAMLLEEIPYHQKLLIVLDLGTDKS